MVPPFRQIFLPFLGAALCAASPLLGQDFKPAPPSTWFHLEPGTIFYSDFALNPGEAKNIDIASQTAVKVGFDTNLTTEQFDQINKSKDWDKHLPKLSGAVQLSPDERRVRGNRAIHQEQ